jgi:PAS domain S-box-containing protein
MHVEEYVQGDFRTSDGMFTVAVDQKITSWNVTAEKLLGHRQDQVLGKKCYEVLCVSDNPGRIRCKRECAVVTNAAKGRTTRDFDLECRAADGSLKQINMSVLLIVGPAVKANERRILHLFRDVTDRRKVEHAAAGNPVPHSQRSDKSVGDLSASGYRLPPLTTREDQVLKLLAAGKNTADISEILSIRPLTARNHVSRLLTKLGCNSRLEAVALGTRAGLI